MFHCDSVMYIQTKPDTCDYFDLILGLGPVSDNSLPQMKSDKMMTVISSFLAPDQLLLTSAGVDPDRMT